MNATIPSNWLKPKILLSQEEVNQKAMDAIQSNMQSFESKSFTNTYWVPVFFSQMVQFDQVTNLSGNFSDKLWDYLNTFEESSPNFLVGNLEQTVDFGYVAIQAYRLYKDQRFLFIAERLWQYGNLFTLTAADVAVGKIDVKNFTIAPCPPPISLTGGTFFVDNLSDQAINESASGDFLLLSILLANATSNATYLDAAKLSYQFSVSQLYMPNNVVADGFWAGSCQPTVPLSETGTFNTGIFLAGVSILGTMTQNTTVLDIAPMVIKAVLSHTSWQDDEGIISDPESRSHMMRGLSIVNRTVNLDPQLRESLQAFMAVQYNSVIDGISTSSLPPVNVTMALDTLLSAVQPTSTSNISSSDTTTKKILAGAITGGVAFLLTLIAAGYFYYRWRGIKAKTAEPEGHIDPFCPPSRPVISEVSQPWETSDTLASVQPPIRFSSLARKGAAPSRYLTPAAPVPSSSDNGEVSRSQEAQLSDASDSSVENRNQDPEHLLTRELVRILNNRLQRGDVEWTARETPPRYGEQP